MAKRLISLVIFIAITLGFFLRSTNVNAFYEIGDLNQIDKVAQKYCDLRKGNQMNLETWYSGKCSADWKERIGFADLFLLDLVGDWRTSYDTGTPTFSDKGKDIFNPVGNFLASIVTTKPASASQYLYTVNQNLAKHNIVQPAYAQEGGYGFNSLGPVIEIWKVFRDITYLLFIIAFVVYGFMIMFRTKISSQTVVSFQTAIPTLIGTLLLVTFSYAIAGLMIDLVYVVQEVGLNAFFSKISSEFSITGYLLGLGGTLNITNGQITTPFGSIDLNNPFVKNMVTTALSVVGYHGPTEAKTIANLIIARYGGLGLPLIYLLIAVTLGQLPQKILGVMIPQTDNSIANGFFNGAFKGFATNPIFVIIVWLVLVIAIFYTFFKIMYMLLQAFVMVIFQVIFAPFILLSGIIPGNDAFGNWARGIISNLAAFPAVTFCFLLSFIFIGTVKFGGTTNDYLPPLINFFVPTSGTKIEMNLFKVGDMSRTILVPPPFGLAGVTGVNGEALIALIGLGIFLMTPKIVEMLQEALKAPAFKYGAAIGEALTYGYGPLNSMVITPATNEIKKEIGSKFGSATKDYLDSTFPGRRTGTGTAATTPPAPVTPAMPTGGPTPYSI